METNLTLGQKEYFPNIKKIKYEGRDSENPLSFKFYDPDKVVAGRPMNKHLKYLIFYKLKI